MDGWPMRDYHETIEILMGRWIYRVWTKEGRRIGIVSPFRRLDWRNAAPSWTTWRARHQLATIRPVLYLCNEPFVKIISEIVKFLILDSFVKRRKKYRNKKDIGRIRLRLRGRLTGCSSSRRTAPLASAITGIALNNRRGYPLNNWYIFG